MPISNFIKSLFKLDGHGALHNTKKRIVQVFDQETAVDQLQSYLKNVQLRIEVLEYYQARYNDVDNNPSIPEYRLDQVEHRLLRLRRDADMLRARITVLKLVECNCSN